MPNRIDTIFLDDGGVLSDNALRGPEWQRLVAEFFAPMLGGDPSSWAESNPVSFRGLLPMLEAGPKGQDYDEWMDLYYLRWLSGMAAHVGVPLPDDRTHCIRLAWQASDYITSRVRAGYPGAAEAVRILYEMGFTLFTASAEHSRELNGYLSVPGVNRYFDRLYGPDLINTWKASPENYRRLFEHSGADPDRSLVVDDNPDCLSWANSTGVKTCLVGEHTGHAGNVDLTVSSLADMPSVLGNVNRGTSKPE